MLLAKSGGFREGSKPEPLLAQLWSVVGWKRQLVAEHVKPLAADGVDPYTMTLDRQTVKRQTPLITSCELRSLLS